MMLELGREWHQPADPWCPCVDCVHRRISTRTWPAQDWGQDHEDYNDILDAVEELERAAENDLETP
jgi:hypothetical protein